MSGESEKKAYEGRSITVTFEGGRCLHAAECVRGLPEVFDTARRPWIQPDGASVDRLVDVVERCPSGALQYRLADDGTRSADRPARTTPG
ncbi:(4Fe-4S)-binding protein [Nocardiopsis sp. CT-R113]|uniref:(4Fe-4S)-binding protein n=1 Tax=Nocardiopsis codii TaxID=3065942 RepID=A0ABU7K9Q0_9ACTN|nr:(4Fe-4S)-binding protein [Nocardiopsis sp. CT-R113]MEE2038979.1 (4Fe-4S)-binding protein [Nocardiopsis sp. CT-R113]